jgi:hypothetical protein
MLTELPAFLPEARNIALRPSPRCQENNQSFAKKVDRSVKSNFATRMPPRAERGFPRNKGGLRDGLPMHRAGTPQISSPTPPLSKEGLHCNIVRRSGIVRMASFRASAHGLAAAFIAVTDRLSTASIKSVSTASSAR